MHNLTTIIPTYRNPQYLDLCLESAVRYRANSNNPICVGVDGYYAESKDVLKKYGKDIFILDMEENRGMGTCLNICAYQATTEYLFIINDDNILSPNFDNRILADMDVAEMNFGNRIVLSVNQVERAPSQFQFPICNFGSPESFDWAQWESYEQSIAEYRLALTGTIFPFCISTKYYKAVGGFDTETFPFGCQIIDFDFFLRLELLEFQCPRTYNCHLFHWGSTASKNGPEGMQFAQREQELAEMYAYKWGIPLSNATPSNSKLPLNKQLRGISV